MFAPLAIAVAQPTCTPYDVVANAAAHAAAVRSAQARVVVFPELSLTGYELDAPPVGADDQRLSELVEACAQARTVALAGAPVLGDAGDSHIATLAIDRDGARVVYRKLCVDSSESHRFAPGREPTVLDVDGWRLGIAICKDFWTPEHVAKTAALGIDAYVAGIVNSPEYLALQDKRARWIAREHRVCVAVASCAGSTGTFAATTGRSGIWTAEGTLLAQAGPEPGAIATTCLPTTQA